MLRQGNGIKKAFTNNGFMFSFMFSSAIFSSVAWMQRSGIQDARQVPPDSAALHPGYAQSDRRRIRGKRLFFRRHRVEPARVIGMTAPDAAHAQP